MGHTIRNERIFYVVKWYVVNLRCKLTSWNIFDLIAKKYAFELRRMKKLVFEQRDGNCLSSNKEIEDAY